MDKNEIRKLRSIVRQESSHFQWIKQALCLSLLILLILVNFCIGSAERKSIITGVEQCDAAYWMIQVIFVVFCVLFTVIAVRVAQNDQALKIKFGGINFTTSDILYNDKKILTRLLVLGFAGGLVAGSLGLGGGSIYNPALLSMGTPPKVSAATSLYLVTFSKIATVLIYFLNRTLDI